MGVDLEDREGGAARRGDVLPLQGLVRLPRPADDERVLEVLLACGVARVRRGEADGLAVRVERVAKPTLRGGSLGARRRLAGAGDHGVFPRRRRRASHGRPDEDGEGEGEPPRQTAGVRAGGGTNGAFVPVEATDAIACL